ncbi:MAG: GMC family oxidoreductase N-terminal domain-containing protein [Acidimicrobiia bacterium]|nr:GMC family oxidoreductase N-terminal domain-containing protein [Acidimicrobiia bacterium]
MTQDGYDYVIVGAGSAGCVLAARLSEDPGTRVALLEAGPRDRKKEIHIPAAFSKLIGSDLDWAYRTTAQPGLDGRTVSWPRGKMLGGSSSINAMIYIRGNRRDYDGWAAAGNKGWAFDDVLGYFRRSEDNSRGPSQYHGVGGPLSVTDLADPNPLTMRLLDAASEAGIPSTADFNGAAQDGAGLFQVTQRRGRRASTAAAFLRPARRRPNLDVITGAHATEIVLAGTRATGVRYRAGAAGVRVAHAEREVVLCGGAINSPQLLMLSGIGPAGHLRGHGIDAVVDAPGVGANLVDHPAVALMRAVTEPVSLLAAESIGNVVRWLTLGRGMLTSNVGEAGAFVRTDASPDAPDIQFHFAPVYFDVRLEEEPEVHAVTTGPTLVRPRSGGRIELTSADPAVAPRIDPGYLSDPTGSDVAALRAGVRLAQDILGAKALAPVAGEWLQPAAPLMSDDEVDAFVRARLGSLYHPVGTCRMGVDDDAVVDPELRVVGTDGLRVVDASVMPTIPAGNTNAPTIMIAEKAADMIRGIA